MKKILPLFLAALFCSAVYSPHTAADPLAAAQLARSYRAAHEQQIIDAFVALLRLPNVATDSDNIRRNAEHIRSLLLPRGFEVQLLESPGSPPAVFASRTTPGADTTVMIYAHYDGQPVNPADWASDPWQPVLRDAMVEQGGQPVPLTAPFDPEWRLFARSAGDDKAPIIALGAALDALDAGDMPLSVNLKLFLDGEEERGSPHLEQMLARHRSLLDADLWLFCDGPVHQSRRWQLVSGVRGSTGFDLTVYGSTRPLHSGHYGNWAPNPIMRLLELIASMRAPDGSILIEGYSDPVVPPTDGERQAIAAAPRMDEALLRELGIGAPETTERLELAILRPALNLRGIRSGGVGADARNAIQPRATASIGLRLVPALTPAHAREAVEAHIRAQGYHILHDEPTDADRANHPRLARLDWRSAGYPAYRSDFNLPLTRRIATIMEEIGGYPPVRLPTMGGSLPIHVIENITGTPVVILPVANHDNNQHAPDENLRIANLWYAIELYAQLLTMPGGVS